MPDIPPDFFNYILYSVASVKHITKTLYAMSTKAEILPIVVDSATFIFSRIGIFKY